MKITKQLIIGAEAIPLNDVDFTLSFAVIDADDLSARDSFKSSTIAIPITQQVNMVFNRFNRVEFEEPENVQGVLQVGSLFFRGDVILHGSERVMDIEVLNVQVVANGFFERLAGVSLRDCIPSGAIEKTVYDVLGYNEEIQDFIFIPVNHGNIYDLNDLKLVELHPIYNCYYAMQYIVGGVGYKLNPETFPLADYKDFVLDFQNLLQNEVDFNKTRAATADKDGSLSNSFINNGEGAVTRYLTAKGIKSTNATGDQLLRVEWENLKHDGDMFSESNRKYTIDVKGSYRIRAKQTIAATVGLANGSIISPPLFEIRIYKNGALLSAYTESATMGFLGNQGTLNTVLEFNTSFLEFEAGDYIEIFYNIIGSAVVAELGELEWNISTNDLELTIDADPRFGIGSTFEAKTHVPDWSAAQFLKNYFTLRNLICEVNEEKKEVLILPKSDYYNGEIIDFTSRIIKTEKIEVTKYNKPAKLTFEFTEDGNDITFVTGENKAEHEFTNTRDPEQVLKLDFAPTKFAPYPAAGIPNDNAPYILSELPDYDNFRHLKYNFKPRILRNYGHVQANPTGTIEGESWDDFLPEMLDVSPAAFKAEYAQDIREMQSAKVMRCSAWIKPHEINSLTIGGAFTLRNLVRVGLNVYKILKIEGWNINNNIARLTLLQHGK